MRSPKSLFREGRFWMFFWASVLGIMVIWGGLTIVFWRSSVVNLNMLSIAALWLACGAGFQSTLAMRKSDPEDPL